MHAILLHSPYYSTLPKFIHYQVSDSKQVLLSDKDIVTRLTASYRRYFHNIDSLLNISFIANFNNENTNLQRENSKLIYSQCLRFKNDITGRNGKNSMLLPKNSHTFEKNLIVIYTNTLPNKYSAIQAE